MPAAGNTGRNNGIIGLVDLPGLNAKFACKIYRWKPRLTGQTRQRRGRGGGVFRTLRWLFSSGLIALEGSIAPADTTALNAAPTPDQYKGQTGTITCTLTAGKTVTYPILVTEQGFDFDAAKNTLPRDLFTAEITGAPTYTGFGTQQAATDPTRSDQQQWEGSSKTFDPSDLQSASTSTIDWWDATVADTDAGESAKLAAIIAAAAAPQTGMKIRTAAIVRDAYDGGIITITWGRTTTAEDWVNEHSNFKSDPDKIATGGTVAAINATPVLPTVSGQTVVSRGTTSYVINDGNTGYVTEGGQRSTKDDITKEESSTYADAVGSNSTADIAEVYDNGDEPVAAAMPLLELREIGKTYKSVNLDESERITKAGTRTSDDEKGFEREHIQIDPNSLKDGGIVWRAYDESGAEPASPISPPPGNVKVIYSDKIPVYNANGSVEKKWIKFWVYGSRDSKDDVILEAYSTQTDYSTLPLNSRAVKSYLDGDVIDATLTDANENVLRRVNIRVAPLSFGLGTNRTLYVVEFGLATSQQAAEIEQYKLEIDGAATPLYLNDIATATKLWPISGPAPTSPDNAPTNNVKLLTWADVGVQENAGLLKRVFVYGSQNSADKLALGSVWPRHRFETVTDVSNLQCSAVRACVISNADGSLSASTNPGTVTDANGNVLVARKTYVHPQSFLLPIHNASLFITEYGLTTLQQDEEFEASNAKTDAFDIYTREDASIVTVGSGTSTDAFADSVMSANISDPTIDEILFKRRTPTLIRQTIRSIGDDQKEHSWTVDTRIWPWWGKPQAGFGNPSAFANPNSYVYVVIPGNSNLSGNAKHAPWRRNRGSFKIRRRVTRANPGDPFLPQVGTVNAISFRGRPAHTVMYVGAELIFNNRQGGTRPMFMDLRFEVDDAMFMNDGLLPPPGSKVFAGNPLSPFAISGFYDPSTFAGAGTDFQLIWPAVSDFTSFGVLNS